MATRTDTGERAEFSYERLLIATGVRPKLPGIPGTDLKNVFTIIDLQDAFHFNEALQNSTRVAIIGAGYVGLEMAECLQTLGKTVHLYEREPHVLPGIFAAGNCAETLCAIRKRPVLHYIGTVAAKQGRVAGDNMAARRTKFYGAIGTTVLKVFDLAVARTGLCSDDAAAESIPVVSARIEAWDRAAYYPTARKLWVKLIAERESRKVVGAQVAGYGDASKRIDVACAAITSGMRVDELVQLDLAYSPPYGNLWDPLLIAAQAVVRKMPM